jgi:putative RNA 2'-phosphotransferase
MGSKMPPKTLAKTLAYIGWHAPWEFGLYWNPDGTMPWKEFYWALQEDESLRFVRESHVRELVYQGLELPFNLDGNQLRLAAKVPAPRYPVSGSPPERLFHACRRRHMEAIRLHGLQASGRPFLVLAADRDLAVRLAKRREPDPIVIEVKAAEASASGTVFHRAGETIFLVEHISVEHLVLPLVRESEEKSAPKGGRAEHGTRPVSGPASPGSFLVQADDIGASATGGKKPRRDKSADWKRSGRKDRHKRNV